MKTSVIEILNFHIDFSYQPSRSFSQAEKSPASLPLCDWSNANNFFQVQMLPVRECKEFWRKLERAENRYLRLSSRTKFYKFSRFNGRRIYRICIEVEKKMIWKKSREEETRPS